MKKLKLTPEEGPVFACLWEGLLMAENGVVTTPNLTKFNRIIEKLEKISVGDEEAEAEVSKTLSTRRGSTVVSLVIVNRQLKIDEPVTLEFEDADFNFITQRMNSCNWNAITAKAAEELIDKLETCKKGK